MEKKEIWVTQVMIEEVSDGTHAYGHGLSASVSWVSGSRRI